jgi:hypothetical protein
MVGSLAPPWQATLKLSNLVTLGADCQGFSRPGSDIASLTVWSRVDVKVAHFEHLNIVSEHGIMDLQYFAVFPLGFFWGFRFFNHFFRTAFVAADVINFRIESATLLYLKLANLCLTSHHSLLASSHRSHEGVVLNFLNS